MLLIASLLLATGSARAACPIDLLAVGDETVAWKGLGVDSGLADIQKTLGHAIELKADPDRPGRHVSVLAGGRPVRLTSHKAGDVLQLTSMWIERIDSDGAACWGRESILAKFKRAAPKSRYLPSRHEPDKPEASNESPTYALDDRNAVVVMLKLSAGAIYVGHTSDLD